MKSFDYIIAGLGLSGSVLYKMLTEAGKKIAVIDKQNHHSSSRVAAGLVNPVTGRRVVKSWMADELIPFAKEYYRKVEKELNINFYHELDVLEVIHTVKEVNEWSSRMGEDGMAKYLDDNSPANIYHEKISPFLKMFRITSSAWMDIPFFIDAIRKSIPSEALIDEKIGESDIEFNNDDVRYKEVRAQKIIYCEGFNTSTNPLWKWLPFLPAKGEILTIRCVELPEEFILMSGIFVIPLGNHLFRVGSTYEWNFTDENPTEEGRNKLVALIDKFLLLPYIIVDHRSGIRPTVKDRRPIIGKHPTVSNAYVFNGMGTKGVQLIPFFANHFINSLEEGNSLMPEIDVKRWYELRKD